MPRQTQRNLLPLPDFFIPFLFSMFPFCILYPPFSSSSACCRKLYSINLNIKRIHFVTSYNSSFYRRDAVNIVSLHTCYGNVASWVGGRLAVTRRYCIDTAKPILKLFRPSSSPIILVSSDPCADTQFQREPLPLPRGR